MMTTDKVLIKIQNQIQDLAPTLELFVDPNIQPSVSDCEALQKQIIDLQENLAVYKFNKQYKELSPSFTLHSKLSAVEVIPPVPASDPIKPINEVANVEDLTAQKETTIPVAETNNFEPEQEKVDRPVPPLSIAINDKFRFMNELFAQNSVEYNIAIEQINNLKNWQDTEIYLNSLRNVYGWKPNLEVVKYFYSLVKKRFD